MDNIKVAKLWESAKIPTRKHPFDAGMDFYCYAPDNLTYEVRPGEVVKIPTGIKVEVPKGYALLLWPKSGSSYVLGAGVIDAEYQGEIIVKVVNISNVDTLIFMNGTPLCQGLLQSVETPEIVEVSFTEIHQVKSERGNDGGINREMKSATFTSTLYPAKEE